MTPLFAVLNGLADLPPDLTTLDRLVLVVLADAQGRNRDAWLSSPSIAARAGASDRGVRRALAHLEDAGLIAGDRRPGLTTRYHVTPDTSAGVPRTPVPGSEGVTPDTMTGVEGDQPRHSGPQPRTPCPGTPDTSADDPPNTHPRTTPQTPHDQNNPDTEHTTPDQGRGEPNTEPGPTEAHIDKAIAEWTRATAQRTSRALRTTWATEMTNFARIHGWLPAYPWMRFVQDQAIRTPKGWHLAAERYGPPLPGQTIWGDVPHRPPAPPWCENLDCDSTSRLLTTPDGGQPCPTCHPTTTGATP